MAKKFVQKWPNFFIKYCDFFQSNNGIHCFLFLSFYVGTKTKKAKCSCINADTIAFLFAHLVLLSCFPSGFTSISQAHDNADYVNTKYMN